MTSQSRNIASTSVMHPWFIRAMEVACVVAVLYGASESTLGLPALNTASAWAGAAVFVAAFLIAAQRGATMPLLLAAGLGGVVMQWAAPGNGAFVAAIATIALSGLRLEPRQGQIVAAIAGVGFLAASAVSIHAYTASSVLSIASGLLFAYLGSAAVRQLRVEQQRTRELLDEVVAGRDARVRAAALDERARLAREMHDVLAHTLSALSIQLEGTRMLAEQREANPEVTAALERAGKLAREGLSEARQAVGSLRSEDLPGPDLLPHLAQDFQADVGTPCWFGSEGEPLELSVDARLTVYRIAQEALTNIRKHSDATSVTMRLSYDRDGTVLIVENEGATKKHPLPSGGYGIRGMRERAALLGGTLETGPTATGYKVQLWLPTRANVPSVS